MNCCTTPGTNKFFSQNARKYEKRFERRGLDTPSRMIADALTAEGIKEKTILDIGCGMGGLHLTLLQRGARSCQGIEIAEGMLNAARNLAGHLGFADRVTYGQGDFVEVNGTVNPADVVILDKVVCCYPEFQVLITTSTNKAKTYYAVSYPRNALIPRISFTCMAWMGQRLNWSFHPYYHNPDAVAAAIMQEGFRVVFAGATILWSVMVFQRVRRV